MFKVLSFMIKFGCLFVIILSAGTVCCQPLNGTYFSLELDGLNIDTTGNVQFYMINKFPSQKWFHEVKVTIEGYNMSIEKYPVYFDSMHHKKYSASDGGFLTYFGKLVNAGGVYISNAKLVRSDYIGVTTFHPPAVVSGTSQQSFMIIDSASDNNLSDTGAHTKAIYPYATILPKSIMKLDCIIRPDKKGIWINNQLYYRKDE